MNNTHKSKEHIKQENNKTELSEMSAKSQPNIAVRIFVIPIVKLRDYITLGLIKTGITPNTLTITGAAFTIIGAYFLYTGAEKHWSSQAIPDSFYAAIFFLLASAMDMLDGNLARIGNCKSTFGGILDSSLDRISDIAIFSGIIIAYARIGNITFVLLSLIALCNAVMISYIKARAECEPEIPKGALSVGYWQRGERMVGIMIACFSAHISTLVLMLATLPALTALRRGYYSWLITNGKPLPPEGGNPFLFWRHKRGSWPFVIISAIYILILALVNIPAFDFIH